ncbi:hypothetical protein WMY93_002439 [Mugilogobius chulae]|uniref:E3 ubiquitin-protein ligase TRIM39-like n=1 Tax=Mugilogobius chulae TaxID=88201 RepID=A0AAW0PTT7_9GOBI
MGQLLSLCLQDVSVRLLLSQLQCPLCLGVFSEPVSVPCGHSFCFSCITSHWDRSVPRVSCPKCLAVFPERPQLCENAFAKDMSSKIKAERAPPQARSVYCDVCVGERAQAVKSCLSCLASDGSCVCVLCAEAAHQGHKLVPVERRSPGGEGECGGAESGGECGEAESGGQGQCERRSQEVKVSVERRSQEVSVERRSQEVSVERRSQEVSVERRSQEVSVERRSQCGEAESGGQCGEAESGGQCGGAESGGEGGGVNVEGRSQEVKVSVEGRSQCGGAESGGQGECGEAESVWRGGAQMEQTEEQLHLKIQERLQRLEDISHNVSLSREQTRQDLQQAEQVFTALMLHLQKVQEELVEQIQKTQEEAELRAQRLVSELQQELKDLRRSRKELQELRQSQDHLHLVQTFSSLTPPDPTPGPSEPVHADLCLGTVRSAVARVELELQKLLRQLCEEELERMQKYAVDVTLDAHTANPWLVLSDDRRSVWDGDREQALEQRPERFDTAPCVLGDKGFTSGRHYWEVEVGAKTAWDVGVALSSVSRRGVVTLSPEDGFWAVCLRRGAEYRACASEARLLPLAPPLPRLLGLFVDHEEGRVSFYDARAKAHLFSFERAGFRHQQLLPFFNPETRSSGGDNSAPLVLKRTRNTSDLDHVTI